tara:strand:- start:15377 stop:15778 length:402 start_codon:yes stop_codon:yes gene_type:complete
MSFKNKIPPGGDWEETLRFEQDGVPQDISVFTNYALILQYESGEEIAKLSKNVVTADLDYIQQLKAVAEVGGRFAMKVPRLIAEALKRKARIIGVFGYMTTDADYAVSEFRPLVTFELGTTPSNSHTTVSLAT